MTRKNKILICLAGCIVYFTSYLTRYGFNALLNQIITSGTLPKTITAGISTGAFITYGLGQIVMGMISDRFDPKKMIVLGLSGTAICNLGMFFIQKPIVLAVIWCVNGCFQAMLWPPLVRIMAELYDSHGYKKSIEYISYASALGKMSVYVLAAFFIFIGLWRSTFIFTAGVAIIAAIIWIRLMNTVPEARACGKSDIASDNEDKKENDKHESKKAQPFPKKLLIMFVIPVGAAIIVQGMLREGISTWMPSYMTEVLGLEPSQSAIVSIILPVFSLLGIKLSAILIKKMTELRAAWIMFGITTILCGTMVFATGRSTIAMAALMACSAGCVDCINTLLINYLPSRFVKLGRAAGTAGLFNAFTYVGSAASIYGVAVVSDAFGWTTTLIVWSVASIIGMAVTFVLNATKTDVKFFD